MLFLAHTQKTPTWISIPLDHHKHASYTYSPTECPLLVTFGNNRMGLRLIFMPVGAKQNTIYLIYYSICWDVGCVV